MTAESCIAFCSTKGFQYAGTEYAQECYCGSSLAAGAAQAAEADCNTACTGDATEPCGGGGRLTLFYSSVPVGPQPNPGVNGFVHIGCYSEGATGRSLTYGVGTIPGAEMTVAKCTAACHTAGYILAGVEYGGECCKCPLDSRSPLSCHCFSNILPDCGNTISNGGARASDGCNVLCNGNQTEFCGGPNRLNVYDYDMQFPTSAYVLQDPTSTFESGRQRVRHGN